MPVKPPPKSAPLVAPALATPTAVSGTSIPPRKPLTLPGKPAAVAHVAKTFNIGTYSDANEGEKILIYAKTGTGKTTLAALAPNPIFIPLDDGARKIPHPVTGQPVNAILGITGFQDLRDALRQQNLYAEGNTLIIDTVSKLEELQEPYIFANYPGSKGNKITSMRGYGWDGPGHQLDVMRLFLSDLDPLVRRGVNVILLAQLGQVTVANAEGADYLEDGPRLQHNKQYSSRSELCEWSDHVFRIGYQDFNVIKENDKARAGKVSQADATRAVFTGGAPHFIAKSRPIDGYRIPPVIPFAAPQDDSLWQYIFEGAKAAE